VRNGTVGMMTCPMRRVVMELLNQLIRIDLLETLEKAFVQWVIFANVTSEACHDVGELVFEVSVIEVNWKKEWNAVSKEEMQGG
jgi:hypothetical protein